MKCCPFLSKHAPNLYVRCFMDCALYDEQNKQCALIKLLDTIKDTEKEEKFKEVDYDA